MTSHWASRGQVYICIKLKMIFGKITLTLTLTIEELLIRLLFFKPYRSLTLAHILLPGSNWGHYDEISASDL